MPIYMELGDIKGEMAPSAGDSRAERSTPDILATAPTESAYEVKLETVLVSSYQTGGHASAGGEIHIESFSWGVSQSGGFSRPSPDAGEELTGASGESDAAFDAFLTLDGIRGETEDRMEAEPVQEGFAALEPVEPTVVVEYLVVLI